jgi:hypothetical protein
MHGSDAPPLSPGAVPATPDDALMEFLDPAHLPENDFPGWARWLLAALWYTIAAALFVAAVAYCAIHAAVGISPLFVVGAFALVVVVLLLFLGEGSEVAVAMLIDKDPDQFDDDLQPWFLKLWRARHRNPPTFIIGRQLIVVLSVVVLTYLCGQLSDVPSLDDPSLSRAGGRLHGLLAPVDAFLREPGAAFAFAVLFPAFLALWIAQLPSKFIAHQNPLFTCSWPPTRWIVRLSLLVGSRFEVERLSVWLASQLLRWQGDVKPHLLPGRRSYYETSAMLRGGRALKRAEIDITIAKDGSASVHESFVFHAFTTGLREIPQRVFWETPYKKYSPVKFGDLPDAVGPVPWTPGVPKAQPEIIEGETLYALDWTIKFASEVPAGEDIPFTLDYETEPGAMKTKSGEPDDYFYTVRLVPTQTVVVRITPAADAPFYLSKRSDVSVVAKASEDRQVNEDEAERVKVEVNKKTGGLIFRVRYPLMSTRFVFQWEVSGREPVTETS